MPDEPVTLFGRLRLTARATVFHPPQVFGRLRPGYAKPWGTTTAIDAYMKARNADAKARRVRLERDRTIQECCAYFAPGTCPVRVAAEAFTLRVTERRPVGRQPTRRITPP